jgi:hypothetical protein
LVENPFYHESRPCHFSIKATNSFRINYPIQPTNSGESPVK